MFTLPIYLPVANVSTHLYKSFSENPIGRLKNTASEMLLMRHVLEALVKSRASFHDDQQIFTRNWLPPGDFGKNPLVSIGFPRSQTPQVIIREHPTGKTPPFSRSSKSLGFFADFMPRSCACSTHSRIAAMDAAPTCFHPFSCPCDLVVTIINHPTNQHKWVV